MPLTDKEMAVIFKADAGQYMIAAEDLRSDENSIRLVAPTYFLRSHAIELLLKACLLAKGWTLDDCQYELGHKLDKAFGEAEKVGLIVSAQTRQTILTLSPLHKDYTFRYRPNKSKPYSFPNQTVATDAVADLFDKVHAIVSAECLAKP